MRFPRTAAAVAAAIAVALSATACSGNETVGDGSTVEPATAAVSPQGTAAPAGTVLPGPAGTALAVAGSTVAALTADGVRIYTAPGAADAPAPRDVAVPDLAAITADGDGFLGVGPGGLTAIGADGAVRGFGGAIADPLSLAVRGEQILVGTGEGDLLVLGRDGAVQRTIDGFKQVDQILVAPETAEEPGQVIAVDRTQSLVDPVDVDTGELKAALRAGNGVTEAVVDPFGRVLASDTRDNEILGFFGQPIVMRFRFPVAHSPYALTYDTKRNLLWVATTGDNQAVGFDLETGMPTEEARFPTVGQVTAVTAAPDSGMLYLLSGRGDGLQAVSPQTAAGQS
ncbi:YncE family protein [Gordonia sp. VNK21]|uniref:YncE family protein n=1 Tax=Gordonia sp. VNK21 TaxID=3382483 RepID=UPI0038D49C37